MKKAVRLKVLLFFSIRVKPQTLARSTVRSSASSGIAQVFQFFTGKYHIHHYSFDCFCFCFIGCFLFDCCTVRICQFVDSFHVLLDGGAGTYFFVSGILSVNEFSHLHFAFEQFISMVLVIIVKFVGKKSITGNLTAYNV